MIATNKLQGGAKVAIKSRVMNFFQFGNSCTVALHKFFGTVVLCQIKIYNNYSHINQTKAQNG